jgi:hypothetical protein
VLAQTAAAPVIADGVAGVILIVMAFVLAAEVPQAFVAVTFKLPEVAPVAKSIVTAAVVPAIVEPEPEYVQAYEVAVGSFVTLYGFDNVFSQTGEAPVIADGVTGMLLIVIACVLAAEVPQAFVAVTLIVPEVAAAL